MLLALPTRNCQSPLASLMPLCIGLRMPWQCLASIPSTNMISSTVPVTLSSCHSAWCPYWGNVQCSIQGPSYWVSFSCSLCCGANQLQPWAIVFDSTRSSPSEQFIGDHTSSSGRYVQCPRKYVHLPKFGHRCSCVQEDPGKIWNNEYIDISCLLNNPINEYRYQLTFKGAQGTSAPAICLEPVTKPKRVFTIKSWFSCFHAFVGIYCKKNPIEAPALTKYGEVVQDLAPRGQNWKFYDQTFRFLQQPRPSLFPCGVINWELWMRSQQSLRKARTRPPSSQSRLDNPPKGHCFVCEGAHSP